jgi:hypothetical protein
MGKICLLKLSSEKQENCPKSFLRLFSKNRFNAEMKLASFVEHLHLL